MSPDHATPQTKALLSPTKEQQLQQTMTLKAAASTIAMALKECDDVENTFRTTYDADSSSCSSSNGSESNDGKDSENTSRHDCDPDATNTSCTASSACSPVVSNLAFFCRKRACLLCFCLVAMGASIVLFGVDVLYGNWVAQEERYQDDGGSTVVERSYQPGNQITFGVLLISILLFQASLSTMLVLFAYQYKRDAQELHDQQQVLLQSTFASATITRLGFFYLKQKAFFTGILYGLVASMICLVISKMTAHSQSHSILLVVGMLLLVGVYLSTVWLIHTRYEAHVQQYESIRSLKRKLSDGGGRRRRRSSITHQHEAEHAENNKHEDDHSWKTVSYFWKKREQMVAHTVALLLFSIVFLILVFLLGDWSQTTSATASASSAAASSGVVYLPATIATLALIVLGMLLFVVSVPMVLLVIPGCYLWDAREYTSLHNVNTRRQVLTTSCTPTATNLVGSICDEYQDALNSVV